MTSPAPIPTERLEEILNGVIGWLAALDYPGVGTQMQRLTDVATALRQQAQPTREEVQAAIRKGLTDNLENLDTGDAFDVDVLLRGCEHAMHSRGYQHPDAAAEILSGAAADAVMGLYASRISSALLPIDAPAREGGGEWEALQAVVSAWEATKAGDTTVPEIQRWLIEDMKPAIDAARRILASHAEPAAHSLQTLAPATDAVKPGDERK